MALRWEYPQRPLSTLTRARTSSRFDPRKSRKAVIIWPLQVVLAPLTPSRGDSDAKTHRQDLVTVHLSPQLRTITDVAERHLCAGCGVCAYLSDGRIEMVDDLERGRRPVVSAGQSEGDALKGCPGAGLEHTYDTSDPRLLPLLAPQWGPIYEVWEGYAADEELRHAASSGGASSALAVYAIEREAFHGVLHIAARTDVPYLNQTVLSRTRTEILAATGSRYAPASPCDGLGLIEGAPTPCVFIGKPCDVAAVDKARRLRRTLDEKVGLTIAFFCAGTPSTRGTLELLRRMGIPPDTLQDLRYRGNGWPGATVATAQSEDGSQVRRTLTYEESWGEVLSSHQQWRCRVCADHTGEFADIAVGDPWHRPPESGDPGRSLVLARTRRGVAFLSRAVAAGYLHLEPAEPEALANSQPNLLRARGSVWGRILACRVLGVAIPRYVRLPMFGAWLSLSKREKVRSILGTLKRVFTKRLHWRARVVPLE